MSEFIDFLLQHWQLSTIFIVVLVGYIIFELHQASNNQAVTPQQAISLYNYQQAVFVDIRSKELFQQNHIIGSINVEISDIDKCRKRLNKFMQKPIIVTCKFGREAPKFAKELKKQGFSQILQLEGGIQAWQTAGLPLTNKK